MASKPRSSRGIPHEVRTATEPRQDRLHPVRLSRITQVNPTIRLLQLTVSSGLPSGSHTPFGFLPGQWLDVHIPSIPQAGGFTITSTPDEASYSLDIDKQKQDEPYVELAVQYSPLNPSAAWLWRPEADILGTGLRLRVGGSFVWPPPPPIVVDEIRKVVFVAGGVGINPLISMLSHIHQHRSNLPSSMQIHLLYSARLPGTPADANPSVNDPLTNKQLDQILFLPRIREIFRSGRYDEQNRPSLRLHITNLDPKPEKNVDGRGEVSGLPDDITQDMTVYNRRITAEDLRELVNGKDPGVRAGTVCYVCGPPRMTDEFVGVLESLLENEKRGKKKVFCEKWW